MADPLTYWQHRLPDQWLVCQGGDRFTEWLEQRFEELTPLQARGLQPIILLAESDPVKFLAGFLAACTANCLVFLCNPTWTSREWQQVLELVHPHAIWGHPSHLSRCRDIAYNLAPSITPSIHRSTNPGMDLQGWIMIPTGGSSGKIRFAIHTWDTLMASVTGFREYFQLQQVNSYCVLPLYHVSGLMQFLRSFTSGGQLVISCSKQLEAGSQFEINPSDFFLSLVPTQLSRLLQSPRPTQWLTQFQTVLLGGAPAWHGLLEEARQYRIPLAPTYGMTETASQIATLKPDDFLRGISNCGQVLPHAQIIVGDRPHHPLPPNAIGKLSIQSKSLCLGYYSLHTSPLPSTPPPHLPTDDLGFLDTQGYLHIVGRSSHKIITGGENVFPIEVESAIQATGMVTDVCVIGLRDRHWGEAVTAVYVPAHSEISITLLKAALEQKLSKFKCPKQWIAVDALPRNAQCKVNYEQLREMIEGRMGDEE
jgi:O-succinylbenzoic acid--CoA ligase